MVICPVALAVGCKRCPVFRVCPAKSLIGDYRPAVPPAHSKRSPSAEHTKKK